MLANSDVVRQILGDGGRWQLRSIFLIYLTKIPAAWFMACVIFTAPIPRLGEYYCLPKGSNVTIKPEEIKTWISIVNPVVVDYHKASVDICQIYVNAEERYEKYRNKEMFSDIEAMDNTTVKCDNFVFQVEHETVVSKFGLVCNRNILISVTQTFHLLGVLVGAVLAMELLKSYDPKTVMVLGMVLQILFGILSGEVRYHLHCLLRTADSTCTGLMCVGGSMIFTDITDKKWRVAASTLFEAFWGVGVILLGLVGLMFKEWNHVYQAISVPTLLLIVLSKYIPNSPQWFLRHGQLKKSKDTLKTAIKYKKVKLTAIKDFDDQLKYEMKKLQDEPTPSKWQEIWENKRTSVNLICVHLLQASAISVHFATLLYISVFGRDLLYINCVVAGVFEIMGTILGYILIRWSPKYKWQLAALVNLLGGVAILLNWFVILDDSVEYEKLAMIFLTMATKFAASCSLAVMAGCTTELVTGTRKKTAAYSVLVFSRVAFLAAPYIGSSWYFLGRMGPISIMGGLTVLNAVLSFIIVPKPIDESANQKQNPDIAKLLSK